MPLYVGDYLGDTSHLSQGQHGAYLLLLMHYWQKGSLPADKQSCYRIAQAFGKQSMSNADAVIGEFFSLIGGRYRNARLDAELARVAVSHNKRVRAGQKRWEDAKHKHSSCNADAKDEEGVSDSDSDSGFVVDLKSNDAEKIPIGQPPLNLAIRLIEDLVMTDTTSNRIVVEAAIKTLVRAGKSPESAFEFLRAAAKDALDRGEAVNRFWFEDSSKWGLGGQRKKNRAEQLVADAIDARDEAIRLGPLAMDH